MSGHDETQPSCENCRYRGDHYVGHVVSVCRRFPPVPVVVERLVQTEWPRIYPPHSEVCGEHKPRT